MKYEVLGVRSVEKSQTYSPLSRPPKRTCDLRERIWHINAPTSSPSLLPIIFPLFRTPPNSSRLKRHHPYPFRAMRCVFAAGNAKSLPEASYSITCAELGSSRSNSTPHTKSVSTFFLKTFLRGIVGRASVVSQRNVRIWFEKSQQNCYLHFVRACMKIAEWVLIFIEWDMT